MSDHHLSFQRSVIRECRYDDGERVPQLVDAAGVPDARVSAYVTTWLRPQGRAYATMENHVRGIARGVAFIAESHIDIDRRLATTGMIFDRLELDKLARACEERLDGKGRIGAAVAGSYFTAFMDYLYWLQEPFQQRADKQTLRRVPELHQQSVHLTTWYRARLRVVGQDGLAYGIVANDHFVEFSGYIIIETVNPEIGRHKVHAYERADVIGLYVLGDCQIHRVAESLQDASVQMAQSLHRTMHSALNAYLAQRPKHRPLTGDIGSRVHAKMMLKKGPYTLVYGLVICEDLKIHHVIGGNTPRRLSDIKLYASLATDQARRFRCRS